jgi:farnesyl-diphosphate farnesyltransferase
MSLETERIAPPRKTNGVKPLNGQPVGGRDLLDELLVKTSRTFALSIPVLPEPTRRQVTVAYLLFRIADTLEDSVLWPQERKVEELERFDRLIADPSPDAAAALAGRWVAEPPLQHEGYIELLAETPSVLQAHLDLSEEARREIARDTRRTIAGMSGFVAREREGVLRLRDLPELREYCYVVAGIVGEMLTELFVLGREQLTAVAPSLRKDAATFGEALQLVNILKDSAADAEEGRSYLPPDLDRKEVLALARRDLQTAGRYSAALHGAGAPRGIVEFTLLPVLLAWATLERVESEGPGAKVTRDQVQAIVARMHAALESGDPEAILAVCGNEL